MANAAEFFETVGKSLSRTADKVAKKADEFIAIQKIKSRQNSMERQMNDDLKNIGEIIFRKFEDEEELDAEIKDICQEIQELQNQIAACKEEIAAKKGERLCPSCGAHIPRNARFCMQCGCHIEQEEPETDSETYEYSEYEEDLEEAEDMDEDVDSFFDEEPEEAEEEESADAPEDSVIPEEVKGDEQ